ncbi:MAG: hypothetical protein ACRCYA_05725 [Cetobacterium sp.]|uniref:hypothetical protein n=1 Tax=Cetobacterium sp. TaxID=2071632 RepID=UPI003EE42C69
MITFMNEHWYILLVGAFILTFAVYLVIAIYIAKYKAVQETNNFLIESDQKREQEKVVLVKEIDRLREIEKQYNKILKMIVENQNNINDVK